MFCVRYAIINAFLFYLWYFDLMHMLIIIHAHLHNCTSVRKFSAYFKTASKKRSQNQHTLLASPPNSSVIGLLIEKKMNLSRLLYCFWFGAIGIKIVEKKETFKQIWTFKMNANYVKERKEAQLETNWIKLKQKKIITRREKHFWSIIQNNLII